MKNGRFSGKESVDMPLLIILFVMIAFGLIMIFSASSPTGFYENGDEFYYIKKQLMWTLLGGASMAFFSFVSYKKVKHYSY